MAEVRVTRVAELRRAFIGTRDRVSKGAKTEIKRFAEPVRADAETFAAARISGISRERIIPNWSSMRTGLTRNAVYVAPRRKGTRGRIQNRRRPGFKDVLLDRAMEPALQKNIPLITEKFEDMVAKAVIGFGRSV